jgi:hypothetical protein
MSTASATKRCQNPARGPLAVPALQLSTVGEWEVPLEIGLRPAL